MGPRLKQKQPQGGYLVLGRSRPGPEELGVSLEAHLLWVVPVAYKLVRIEVRSDRVELVLEKNQTPPPGRVFLLFARAREFHCLFKSCSQSGRQIDRDTLHAVLLLVSSLSQTGAQVNA